MMQAAVAVSQKLKISLSLKILISIALKNLLKKLVNHINTQIYKRFKQIVQVIT